MKEKQRELLIDLGAIFMPIADDHVNLDKVKRKPMGEMINKKEELKELLKDYKGSKELASFIVKYLDIKWPVLTLENIVDYAHVRDHEEFKPLYDEWERLMEI